MRCIVRQHVPVAGEGAKSAEGPKAVQRPTKPSVPPNPDELTCTQLLACAAGVNNTIALSASRHATNSDVHRNFIPCLLSAPRHLVTLKRWMSHFSCRNSKLSTATSRLSNSRSQVCQAQCLERSTALFQPAYSRSLTSDDMSGLNSRSTRWIFRMSSGYFQIPAAMPVK